MRPTQCVIAAAACRKLHQLASAAADGAETGGELVGFLEERSEGLTFVVVDLCGPGPGARRSYSRFGLDADHIQAEIRRLCANHGGWVYSIGGWHTHFQADPTPSGLDDQNGRTFAAWRAAWDPPVPLDLEVIVGVVMWTGDILATRAWCYDPDGRRWDVDVICE